LEEIRVAILAEMKRVGAPVSRTQLVEALGEEPAPVS